jgi:hypothetical protein
VSSDIAWEDLNWVAPVVRTSIVAAEGEEFTTASSVTVTVAVLGSLAPHYCFHI